ncbi:MAG: response regulator [Mariprofundaceae bacterium]|nr:response regulator [Mariprofundaceae bacterium]
MSKQKQVLIIEDEENIQGILSAFIERYFSEREMQVNIKSMDDPIRGLYDLSTRGELYDLIILDVRLPKLGGDEIYNSISHVTPGLVNRIMFVTGYPDDLTDRWPDKKFTILEKPFRYDALSEKISSILNN